jgi:signal transduction histidine kinase
MVNEMLDITKIERGDLEMNLEELNVKEIISSVVADLQTYAERHEFTIQVNLPEDIFVHADRVRLRQIFQNLVDNSIKYSNHPGKLNIDAERKGNLIMLSFIDNGIGVPKNEQPKLFERFYRASNTAKTASSGSGLGLYIVKSIAEQFGGDISFESEEGKGTTFHVTLPVINKTQS